VTAMRGAVAGRREMNSARSRVALSGRGPPESRGIGIKVLMAWGKRKA
jgi:hypothetical protein